MYKQCALFFLLLAVGSGIFFQRVMVDFSHAEALSGVAPCKMQSESHNFIVALTKASLHRQGRVNHEIVESWFPTWFLGLLSVPLYVMEAVSPKIQGLTSGMIQRSEIYDSETDKALSTGITNMVIIGCGFDDRGLRKAKAGFTVQEYDLPSVIETRKCLIERDAELKKLYGKSLTLQSLDLSQKDIPAVYAPTLYLEEAVLLYVTLEERTKRFYNLIEAASCGSHFLLWAHCSPAPYDTCFSPIPHTFQDQEVWEKYGLTLLKYEVALRFPATRAFSSGWASDSEAMKTRFFKENPEEDTYVLRESVLHLVKPCA